MSGCFFLKHGVLAQPAELKSIRMLDVDDYCVRLQCKDVLHRCILPFFSPVFSLVRLGVIITRRRVLSGRPAGYGVLRVIFSHPCGRVI